ncbi:MAG TPA: hypothetical protein VFG10_21045 [Saprospiraceae bacterium]|nr:hypothetical protein [Saprospiraceae bacterium]
MRQIIKPFQSQLIPFREESELELMSLNLQLKSQKQGLDKIIAGTIQSIYSEPMVAFTYKDYIKGVREALLCCKTSDTEIIFRIKKQNVDVYYNGSQVAMIDQNNTMHGLKSRGVLGRIRPYSNDLISIIVKDREVGQMFNPLRPHAFQQRAFTLLARLNSEEEAIFISITLYEMLTRILENKRKK